MGLERQEAVTPTIKPVSSALKWAAAAFAIGFLGALTLSRDPAVKILAGSVNGLVWGVCTFVLVLVTQLFRRSRQKRH